MSGPRFDLGNDDLWAMFMVRCTCCSALSFLTCEWLLSLSFEVSTIWNSSTTCVTQLLYCISRYLGLIAVMLARVSYIVSTIVDVSYSVDSVLVSRIHGVYTVDPEMCRWWFGSQAFTVIILLFGLEMLLTMRVLALYLKAMHMNIFLFGLLASKTLAMMFLAVLTVQDYGFGSACLTEKVPATAIYICAMQMINQAMIWWLTLLRHWQFVRRDRLSVPLLQLVTRDGSWVFVLLTAISTITLVASMAGLYGGSLRYRAKYSQLMFPIVASVLSFSTCRIIINLQEFIGTMRSSEGSMGGHSSDDDIQFTTLILSST